jgi:hypothetical protein
MFGLHTGIAGLDRLVQYGRDRSTARLVLELEAGGRVNLGSPDNLFSQTEFGRTVAIATQRMPKPLARKDWDTLVAALLLHATDVVEVEAEQLSEAVLEWIQCGYQDRAVVVDTPDDETVSAGEPYQTDGRLMLTATHLADHLRREVGETVSSHALRVALREIGAERVTVHYRRGGGSANTSRSYYSLSLEILA